MSEVHEIENFLIKTNEKPKKKDEQRGKKKENEGNKNYIPTPHNPPLPLC